MPRLYVVPRQTRTVRVMPSGFSQKIAHRGKRSTNILFTSGVALVMLDRLYLEITGLATFISFPGYSFHIIDLGIIILAASVAVSIRNVTDRSASNRDDFGWFPLLVLAIVIFTDTVRGLYYDPFSSLFSLRERLPFVLMATTALLNSPARDFNYIKVVRVPAVLMMLAIISLFSARAIIDPHLFLSGDSLLSLESNELRAITSYAAIFLTLFSIAFFDECMIKQPSRSRRLIITLSLIAIAVVFLSRQRTATIAAVVGLITYLSLAVDVRRRMPIYVKVIVFALAMGALILVFVAGPSGVYQGLLPESFRHAAEKRATLDFRRDLWASAIGNIKNRGVVDALFGPAAGQAPTIYVDNIAWISSLHSYYIQTLFDYGIIGAGALLAVFVLGLYNGSAVILGKAVVNADAPRGAVVLSWLATVATYGYTYGENTLLSVSVVVFLLPRLQRKNPASHFSPRVIGSLPKP